MWPPLWGWFYWPQYHSAALAFEKFFPDQIPQAMQTTLIDAISSLCAYLPCPGCTIHCNMQVSKNPPKFTSGKDFWIYMRDFHNAVNERTKKIKLTDDEAREVTRNMLARNRCTADRIEDAFLTDVWIMLYLSAYTNLLHYNPDPKATEQYEPKPEQQQNYTRFVRNTLHIMPFSFHDETIRQEIDTIVNDPELFHVQSLEAVETSLTRLFNALCERFGVEKIDNTYFNKVMQERFSFANNKELSRAHQMREEDHQKILGMQAELDRMRQSLSSKMPDTSNGVSSDYKTATIILAVLVGVFTVLTILTGIAYRRKYLTIEWKKIKEEKVIV